jgi:hypothetical protein
LNFHEQGGSRGVLEAQAEAGFAFVPEAACERVLKMKGKPIPPGDEEDNDRKTILALACISAIKPDTRAEDAAAAINFAFLAEHPDCYARLQVDPAMLADVVEKTEVEGIQKFEAGLQTLKAKKVLVMQTRERFLPKYFKLSPPPKYTAAQKKTPRWLPPRDEENTLEITKWIRKHGPPNVKVKCDDYNGRWRVIAPTLDWKSISWSKRGFQLAASEVLLQAWEYEKDFSGVVSPYSLEEFQKQFAEAN